MPNNEQHYQLWKPRNNPNGSGTNGRAFADRGSLNHPEEEADFFRVRNSKFCTHELIIDCQQVPPHRSLVELINSTLVVGQEVSLAVILLAVHREIVTYEEGMAGKITTDQNVLEYIVEKSSIAMVLVYVSMFIITYYNQRALAADSEDGNSADCKTDKDTSQHKHKK
eukprot:scaffold7555_cov134-Skeletonema_marinoi.AAC.6